MLYHFSFAVAFYYMYWKIYYFHESSQRQIIQVIKFTNKQCKRVIIQVYHMSFWFKPKSENYKLFDNNEEKDGEWLIKNMNCYYGKKLQEQIPANWLNKFSLIGSQDEDRKYYTQLLKKWKTQKFNFEDLRLTPNEGRALGCLVGLSIGDALGASTEFEEFDKERVYWIQNDFHDVQQCVKDRKLNARHDQIGVWTDDCSMALAMATSLLSKDFVFDPIHIRYMFALWLDHGLGNGGRSYSIGLGGNISLSMHEFSRVQKQFTEQGDKQTSGNGSLMRLAPVPLLFRGNEQEAVNNCGYSSLTTHQGIQAFQCARLLGLIMIRLMNRMTDSNWKEVLDQACNDYVGKSEAVKMLAMSKCQTQQIYKNSCNESKSFRQSNPSIQDRNWNWKDPNFTYSKFRAHRQPGYIGSYCMDALSMSLHIVWNKGTFKEMVLWAINMGGDCDTTGAIVGQIAGAIFGFNEEMFTLYSQMKDFTSERMEVFLLGLKLATKRKSLQNKAIEQEKMHTSRTQSTQINKNDG